jgi:hypothetical protein
MNAEETMAQSLSIHLPDTMYQPLLEAARAAEQPLEDVVVQSIRVGLPPDLSKVPARFRADLRGLSRLDTPVLRRVAQAALDAAKATRYEALLMKNQRETLLAEEQAQLDRLREEADLLMLRRAYAYALLKWRGQRLPALQDS